MDQTNIVINSVKPLGLAKVEIEASNAKRYVCDLSEFSQVKCFPKDQIAWEDVSITTHGFNLTWGSCFEVHALQLIGCATSEENIKLHA